MTEGEKFFHVTFDEQDHVHVSEIDEKVAQATRANEIMEKINIMVQIMVGNFQLVGEGNRFLTADGVTIIDTHHPDIAGVIQKSLEGCREVRKVLVNHVGTYFAEDILSNPLVRKEFEEWQSMI